MPADEVVGPMTVGKLLGVACNPMPSEQQERLLATAIRDMPDWDGLEPALSVHRLGPLLHWQIRHYGIDCPAPVRRVLAGMYAREKEGVGRPRIPYTYQAYTPRSRGLSSQPSGAKRHDGR